LPAPEQTRVDPLALTKLRLRDRLEHSALTIHITGPTYRGVKAKKLASRKKDA
jgi:hypothetical protein